MEREQIIKEIVDAQADLQTGLGVFRLVRRPDLLTLSETEMGHIEDRLAKSLARLHKLLEDLGNPMYHTATHPDVN